MASLVWFSPEAPIDLLTLELGGEADYDAPSECGDFFVPVHVEITTRDQGLLASGPALLKGSAGQFERASLEGLGERMQFYVDLVNVEGEVRISGFFRYGDPDLPGGGDATFPDPNAPRQAGGGG